MDKVKLKELKCSNALAALARKAIFCDFVNPEEVAKKGEPAFARPAHAQYSEGAMLSALSHLGGQPHLPEGFVWPEAEYGYKEKGMRPLVFMAQYDLRELSRYDLEGLLPDHGLMVIFGCGEAFGFDGEHSRIYVFDDVYSLKVTQRPADPPCEKFLETDRMEIPLHRIVVRAGWQVPHEWSSMFDTEEGDDCDADWGMSREQLEQISDSYEELFAELAGTDGYEELEDDTTQFLGWGEFIQGDYTANRQCRLLYTQSSFCDENLKKWQLCIGDAGAIYYFIDEDDLKAGRFDQVRSHMDCY